MRAALGLLVIVGSALLLVACSGDDDEPATSTYHEAASVEALDASDGVRLDARHFPAAGERLVILLHMYPANQTSWFGFAEELQARGIDALTFDFRGYGMSGGEKDPGVADLDARAALAFARARGFERVVLIGASMGGTAAIVVAADEAVDGVATLSAPAAMSELDAATVIAGVQAPVTLVAANDDLSGAESARDLAARADLGERDVLLVAGRAHGTELLEEHGHETVRGWLLDFLDRVWGP
jgi:pimeloyl-ACP methyl ester carboxylesterase